eukprot:scaffold239297_cov33-Tisochrysis_lutea.AAC.5
MSCELGSAAAWARAWVHRQPPHLPVCLRATTSSNWNNTRRCRPRAIVEEWLRTGHQPGDQRRSLRTESCDPRRAANHVQGKACPVAQGTPPLRSRQSRHMPRTARMFHTKASRPHMARRYIVDGMSVCSTSMRRAPLATYVVPHSCGMSRVGHKVDNRPELCRSVYQAPTSCALATHKLPAGLASGFPAQKKAAAGAG